MFIYKLIPNFKRKVTLALFTLFVAVFAATTFTSARNAFAVEVEKPAFDASICTYGDVVTAEIPSTGMTLTGRIVGFSGDCITLDCHGRLIRNRVRVDESSYKPTLMYNIQDTRLYTFFTNESDCVFILNDDRYQWSDSRSNDVDWVPISSITGLVESSPIPTC